MTRKRKQQSKVTRNKRRVMQIDGYKRTYNEASDPAGYDVEMIRDFLDHLLLELRTQHFEHTSLLRMLESSDNAGHVDVKPVTEPALAQKFIKFLKKYPAFLITVIAINNENVTAEEAIEAKKLLLKQYVVKRDEQIGHLEALTELFDEALQCAKMPIGPTNDGQIFQPGIEYSARSVLDNVTS